jgi:undecaprenyl-diphosphatase
VVLLLAERLARHERSVEDLGAADALLIGIGQAVALVPGSSRSGTTITAGMLLGLKREAAARFSFLLSVPIILGAGVYKLWKQVPVLRDAPGWALATAVGTAVSAVAGYLVIGWLLGWLRTRTTYVFVVWRFVAGAAVAALIAAGVLPGGAERPRVEAGVRAQGQPDEAAPAHQWAPNDERGFAAGTDLERAGDWGARPHRAPQQDR